MKITGDKFTIYEVEDLHKEFISELDSNKSIEVDFDGVLKVDMPAIQLLISAFKTCKKNSVDFSVVNLSEELEEVFKVTDCEFLLKGAGNE